MASERTDLIESAYRFCGIPEFVLDAAGPLAKWPTPHVRWYISGALPGILATAQREAYELAWSWWAEVCGVQPEYTADAAQANVLMGAGRIDGPKQTLAWSELPSPGRNQLRQQYDIDEPWVIAEMPPLDRIDLVRVACHEIGHALGMPHIGAGNLMAPTYDPRIRKPRPGDVAEMVARYGPPKVTPPPPAEKLITLWAQGLPEGYALKIGDGPVATE